MAYIYENEIGSSNPRSLHGIKFVVDGVYKNWVSDNKLNNLFANEFNWAQINSYKWELKLWLVVLE